MKRSYKLEKFFGPVGSSAGLFLFFAGLIISCFSFAGIVVVLLGAFMGFTYTCAIVDFDKKRAKHALHLLGILPIGNWISIDKDMRLGFKKDKKVWRTFSRSNRSFDTNESFYMLFICDSLGKEILPLMKVESIDSAMKEIDEIGKRLGISAYNC